VAVDRPRGPWALAGIAGAALVLLTVLVAAGATQDLDVAVRHAFRPDGVWGPAQVRANRFVDLVRPRNIASVLVLAAIVEARRRRSWRPVAYAAIIGGVTGLLSGGLKILLGRPDPQYQTFAHTGSFPSGHTVSVIVCLGGALLVLQARTRWWQWVLVAVAGLVMGVALITIGAHWCTDVLGGALLAVGVLAAASQLSVRRPAGALTGPIERRSPVSADLERRPHP
jgi:membrane-associated phospholipid phosphatase